MFWTVRTATELYVYWRGVLIYKRWLGPGYGRVFDAWGPPWKPGEYRP